MNKLHSWATEEVVDGHPVVRIETNVAYPEYLALLGLEVDQYGAELAFLCCTKEIQALYDGKVDIIIGPAPNWSLANLPEGLGIAAAHRDFAATYTRLQSLRL